MAACPAARQRPAAAAARPRPRRYRWACGSRAQWRARTAAAAPAAAHSPPAAPPPAEWARVYIRLFISCLTYACSQQTFSQTHRRCTQCTSLPAAAAAMHLKPHYSRREPHSSRTRTPLKPPYSRTSARRRSVSSRGGRRWCRSARNALSAPCLPRSASPTAATWEDGSGQG